MAALALGAWVSIDAHASISDEYPTISQQPLTLDRGTFQIDFAAGLGSEFHPVASASSLEFGFAWSPFQNVQLEVPLLVTYRLVASDVVDVAVTAGFWDSSIPFNSSYTDWQFMIGARARARISESTSLDIGVVLIGLFYTSKEVGLGLVEAPSDMELSLQARRDLNRFFTLELTVVGMITPGDVFPLAGNYDTGPNSRRWSGVGLLTLVWTVSKKFAVYAGVLGSWSRANGPLAQQAQIDVGGGTTVLSAAGPEGNYLGFHSGVRWRF